MRINLTRISDECLLALLAACIGEVPMSAETKALFEEVRGEIQMRDTLKLAVKDALRVKESQ